jgi:disulfide bond formation protein DsbB
MTRFMPSRLAVLAAAVLAAAAPLTAKASEGLLGLAPCELCQWQRWPYWAGAGLALAAALVPARQAAPRRVLLALAGVAVLASGAIGAFHIGVEQHWWPSPLAGCQAPRIAPGASVDEMLRSLAPGPTKPCDAPNYLIPGVPLSVPALNLIYALGLGGWILILASRGRRGAA